MAEVTVLGAGMVGVSSALALQEQGHHVTLVDKVSPGLETSYGNAGIIQSEAAEPYALPQDIVTLWRFAMGQTNDVTWKLIPTIKMAPALWRYFRNSAPKNHSVISAFYAQLAAQSTRDHELLIRSSGADTMIRRTGLAMLYRDERRFQEAVQKAECLEQLYGVNSRVVNGVDYQAEEPALKQAPIGAVHWLQSWSCSDPGGLTAAYAELFIQRGGTLVQGDANSLQQRASGWHLKIEEGDMHSEHVVVAMGPWSPQLLKRFGYDIPMVYKRGYHGHYKAHVPLNRPFLDVENGVLASPMSRGIRVTTGAALVGLNDPAEPIQLERGVTSLRTLLKMGDRVRESQWFGTRPCMPDMLPVVGAAPNHKGMWFHFGHGHQGFTQGPTTAKLLAQSIAGESSELLSALAPDHRF
ncbi:NAD(P)/FAD-dependent oxidoreductase [Marinomonas atlantica]|uniref:NAD(P)/FAD-dependent oxidoreductase n=1 Tax=Marinomonas atlantica TaxID=1806668 RepID=UPI0008358D60|nr:FAD-binding oxidoreductase [Marinomonas atlantica]